MANPARRVPQNASGDLFVDDTCIDCDACRQIAPGTFAEGPTTSYVQHQPHSESERRLAWRALVSCPTGSIGDLGHGNPKIVMDDFPVLVEEPVYYCGFTSPKSYGGNSYFVRHPEGNWLIDSPKFLPALVRRIEALGGLRSIFLTHQDDVADADRFAQHFQAERIIHQEELASQPDAERVLTGAGPWELAPEFTAVSTPGHTRGHCVLLFRNRFLFTGDHLAWNRAHQTLEAFRDYCWHSWNIQTQSMRALTQYTFEWVLPGHGQRVHLPRDEMRQHLDSLVRSMAVL